MRDDSTRTSSSDDPMNSTHRGRHASSQADISWPRRARLARRRAFESPDRQIELGAAHCMIARADSRSFTREDHVAVRREIGPGRVRGGISRSRTCAAWLALQSRAHDGANRRRGRPLAPQRAQPQNRLSAFKAPPRPSDLHPVADHVAARAFDAPVAIGSPASEYPSYGTYRVVDVRCSRHRCRRSARGASGSDVAVRRT